MTPHERRLMQEQRDARLLRDAGKDLGKRAGHSRRRVGSLADFWDLIDSSGGPDACHPWTGPSQYNHPAGHKGDRYLLGSFDVEKCRTRLATRILVFAAHGVELSFGEDVTPICGDHLCCNLRHLAVTYHGGGPRRIDAAVPVAEYMAKRGGR